MKTKSLILIGFTLLFIGYIIGYTDKSISNEFNRELYCNSLEEIYQNHLKYGGMIYYLYDSYSNKELIEEWRNELHLIWYKKESLLCK